MRRPPALLRSSFTAAPLLASALSLGCTQNFSQFDVGESTLGAGGSTGSTSTGAISVGSSGQGGSGTSAATTSASTSASTAASTSASTTTSTSAGMGTPESCLNGLDDDGDGDIDCADSDCTPGFTCVPTAPSGWNGPVAYYEGNPASVPACPPTHPVATPLGNSGLTDTPAQCSACTCGAPSGQCELQPLSLTDDQCGSTIEDVPQPQPGVCAPFLPPIGLKAATAEAPTYAGGGCTPSAVSTTLPPPVWQSAGLSCSGGGLGGGCSAKSSCVPVAEAPFVPGLCVWRTGNVGCPKGFPDKHTLTSTVNDSRTCTPCACGDAGVTCSATTSVYNGISCAGTAIDVPNDGSCVSVGGAISSLKVAVTKTGSCAPSGGQPSGKVVEGALKTTVCCAP